MSANLVFNDDKKPWYYKFDKLYLGKNLIRSFLQSLRLDREFLELKSKNTMAKRSQNLA